MGKRKPDLAMGWWDPAQEQRPANCRDWASTYEERDEIVRYLGFGSYAEYLASELWESIKARVLRDKKRCYLCKRRGAAVQAHHHRYTRGNLSGKNLQEIYPLCAFCHVAVEFTQKREKRSLKDAQKRFAKLRAWRKWPKIVEKKRKRYSKRRKRRRTLDPNLIKADHEWQDMETEFDRLMDRDG